MRTTVCIADSSKSSIISLTFEPCQVQLINNIFLCFNPDSFLEHKMWINMNTKFTGGAQVYYSIHNNLQYPTFIDITTHIEVYTLYIYTKYVHILINFN